MKDKHTFLKYIALYLPQFHEFEENNKWWGKGFTEWTNTKSAKPSFEGHYQPHEPHEDIGYYDLSDVDIMIKQSEMAKEHGIYGFAYYYYWFNGHKIMNKPIENMLENKKVDIPFCMFWANHNWTRSWDGGSKEIMLEQTYEDDKQTSFIDDLYPYFADDRYIKVNGSPVLIVYQALDIPNTLQVSNIWRDYAKERYGLNLYLVTVQQNNTINPEAIGYDAALETAPQFIGQTVFIEEARKPKIKNGVELLLCDYLADIYTYLSRPQPEYKLFNCVYPMWDNTARRKEKGAVVFYGNTPSAFRNYLIEMSKRSFQRYREEERFVFINAWNEWAEGTHLEPCKKYGYTFLNICKDVHSLNCSELLNSGFKEDFYRQMMDKNEVAEKFEVPEKVCLGSRLISKTRDGNKRTIRILGVRVFSYTRP